MAFDFTGFEVCAPPLRQTGEPYISYNHDNILIPMATYRRLGSPQSVVFCFSEKKRQLAIRPWVKGDSEKARYEVRKSGNCHRISSVYIAQIMAKLAGVEFEGKKFRRARGEYYKEDNVAIFDLSSS